MHRCTSKAGSVLRSVWGGALALLIAGIAPVAAQAQGWGDIKGQVVWGQDKLPELAKANVNKDQAHCLSKGQILTDDYVVNPKNKGVQYVLVWLVDATTPSKALPIHSSLTAVPKKPVVIDQPCCKFIPRVTAVREGQTIEVKNPAPVAHNFFINGGVLGPNVNQLMPPNTNYKLEGVKARSLPMAYSCSIHPWMKGYIGVFKHPYFAVTDEDGKFTIPKAPAGKYRLVLWQDTKGFVLFDPKTKQRGMEIVIKADGTTDVGQVKLVP